MGAFNKLLLCIDAAPGIVWDTCSVGKILPGIQDVRNTREWVPTAGAGRGKVARKHTGDLHVPLQSLGMPPEQTSHSLVNSGTKNEHLCWNPLYL